jgi:hypothetical protein
MSVYNSDKKNVRDQDLMYWNAGAWTAASVVSDTIDLGAAQVFHNIPAIVWWEFSADFSLPSSNGLAPPWQGIVLEDAADGSTFAAIMAFPLHSSGAQGHNLASTIVATTINAKTMGVGTIRRYSRLVCGYTNATGITIKAGLRLGLSADVG